MDPHKFEAYLRAFETVRDQWTIPDMYVVVRLDGHQFHQLAERRKLTRPFDVEFNIHMINVVQHLMRDTDFHFKYAYHQSDEISLLLADESKAFNGKYRKILSLLPAAASGVLSIKLGEPITFDARIIELPSLTHVIDYFRWRASDSWKNAVSAYAFWSYVKAGNSHRRAASAIRGKSSAEMQEMLFSQFGININDTPAWERRGTGFYWQRVKVKGFNPRLETEVDTYRNTLIMDRNLPQGNAYGEYLQRLIDRKPQHVTP